MTHKALDRLLGNDDRDPGCEGAFAQLDEYCEALRRGEDVARRYAEFITHITNCAACREDTEGLLAILRSTEEPGPGT